MHNITVTTTARFAVAEYMEEYAQERDGFEVVACAFIEIRERELEAERAERYAEIKARYEASWESSRELTSEEFWFMMDYEEEQWRNSEAYARNVAWLADPANRDDINYSDIYKDVYGFRPRW